MQDVQEITPRVPKTENSDLYIWSSSMAISHMFKYIQIVSGEVIFAHYIKRIFNIALTFFILKNLRTFIKKTWNLN